MRLLKHHPRHLPERLVVYAVTRLAEPTKGWAAERLAEGVDPEEESARIKQDTVVLSRVNGAVAGTPFFIALLPAYLSFLWAQARLVMRIAALHGRDPTEPRMAAEVLTLRGVYPSVDEAQHALDHIGEEPKDAGRRDRMAAWVFLVRRVLILAAFTSASNPDDGDAKPSKLRQGLGIVAAAGIWLMTCVIPVTFMILMSWSCESSSRQIGSIAMGYYGEAPDEPSGTRLQRIRAELRPDPGRGGRRFVRWGLLILSVGVPVIAFGMTRRR